jgi:hypothetical protein
MSEGDESEKKVCFVIGPIDDPGSEVRRHADWLLDGIIKPVLTEHFPEFTIERADKIAAPGMINSQVIARLMDAPLVVSDMSYHNANAFYELAIRHMVRLPTIHIICKPWKIPFDVAPHRAIVFSRDDYSDLVQARHDLKSAVDEVMKPGFIVENPITHARGRIELDRHATPQTKVLMDAVESLGNRMSKLEDARAANERDAMARALLAMQSGGTSHRVTLPSDSASGGNFSATGPSAGTDNRLVWSSSGWRKFPD